MIKLMKNFILSISLALFLLSGSFLAMGQIGWQYISPLPGSKWINPEQTISFRMGEQILLSSLDGNLLQLEGSKSGSMNCDVVLADDGRTVIFTPEKPFAFGETIQVTLKKGITTLSGKINEEITFSFQIKPRETISLLAQYYIDQEEEDLSFVKNNALTSTQNKSVSELITYGDYVLPGNYMSPTITALNNPFPGYTFATPRPNQGTPYKQYNVILDQFGEPVFFLEWTSRCNLFQKIVDDKLIFCAFSNHNPSVNKWYVLNHQFQFIDTLYMGNGYTIDQHGIYMMENGNHLLIAYDPQPVGMDTVYPGGNPNASVVGLIIQELDANHNVLFQWRSWDHFNILDGNHVDFTAASIDYVHGNSVSLTLDNQILISCRRMDEVTKIDRNTGDVLWRFGLHAQNNMFSFTNDTTGFSHQHDARQIENGNFTVYDNGVYHTPPFSRGVEYELDESNLTATLVWDYSHDPLIYANATGSNHRLPNNNSLICWGLTWPIAFTEVNSNNEIQWELNYPDFVWNFQAFRQTWETGLFSTNFDTIDYGYYHDYIPWPVIVTITNQSDDEITINSASNHSPAFSLATQLPQTIATQETKNFIVNFYPEGLGQQDFEDVITFNYDSYFGDDSLSRRIARQVVLKGTTIDPSSIDAFEKRSVGVFPNPTSGMVEIHSQEGIIEQITVSNIFGEVVQQQPVSSGLEFNLDLGELANGIYFIKIKLQNHDQQIVKKLIKR